MAKTAYCMDFTTDNGGQYVLDGNTGAAIATNEIMRKAIDLYTTRSADEVIDELAGNHPVNEVREAVKFLRRWSTHYGGLYRTDELNKEVRERMEAATERDYEKYLADGNITQLTLTITEDCNFRCAYCSLSEEYQYTRNRSNKVMSPETGIKALDMYFDHLRPLASRIPGKVNVVTFYGGEPLMNLGLMKKLIGYAQTHCPTNLLLNLTTNGYLLTDSTVDYLVDNDVKVCVSLDGTRENHDRNRVLANGKGTFDVVYRNIKRFQQRYPDYPGLMLLPVFDWQTDLEANVRFFKEDDLPLVAFVNGVANVNTGYYSRFTGEDYRKHREQLARLLEQYKGLRRNGDTVPDYLEMLFSSLALIHFRIKGDDGKPFLTPYTSCCIPGFKIHVRVDGTLDMCERINQTFPIGHVDTGLDYAAMKRTMDLYNSGVTAECDTCALYRYCRYCPAICNKECYFCHEATCADVHTQIKSDYGIAYSLYEENPHAFDNLDFSLFEQMAYHL